MPTINSERPATLMAVLSGLALLAAATSPAEARIACRNGYQLSGGALIATPYCQDKLVAEVARQHGFRVSDREILYNPNSKRRACAFVGRDIRLTTACANENSYGRGRF